MEFKQLLVSLSSLMSVSGSERYSAQKLNILIGDVFDEFYTDDVGNHVFIKRCGRENAPKIMVDCHFDEIGMFVTSIKEGGFVTVEPVGGVDSRLLQSGEVIIYGEKEIYGVFASTPPHLISDSDANKLKPVNELLIDTGYSKEELEQIVQIGTPVGYRPVYTELLNGRIAGKGFDDKACGACAVQGIANVERSELAGDVYFVFTTREECGMVGGATGAYGTDPDYALVMDVTHAWIPEMNREKWGCCGSGVSLSVSAVTNRRLTKMSQKLCRDKEINYTVQAEPGNTGTDANKIGTARFGIPSVLASLPLKNMHSANEVLALEDCEALIRFVSEFIKSEEIAEVFAR